LFKQLIFGGDLLLVSCHRFSHSENI